MLRHLPLALVYSRLVLGLVILLGCLLLPAEPLTRPLVATLVVIGLLTDVFDGILARRLGVATHRLRRLDSSVDTVFWLCIVAGTLRLWPRFFPDNALWICLVLGLEALTYVVSYLRFRREIALHTLAAKAWALLLMATMLQLILTGQTGLLFSACVVLGVLSRLETLAIVGTLRVWAADVPSLYHARQLRRGQAIRRHPLFNG
ncbi:CDP-alcohol phosphatidyltransferase family protein [Hymenobacter sp. J193]|uniref:CDP-alcohol phosphatidyltransferase family protein n=1 Tax=Hymenobacter sp. J193 TaxID=2898429 RepID=UPI002151C20B|nr:CDP-alcohol phosphatidyltransferase family protein [Hymenobacter sp. J193]MCR5886591.1 CDP-alcohol phosphatidyltransferase family protein [Hymenobacter sp. J193]